MTQVPRRAGLACAWLLVAASIAMAVVYFGAVPKDDPGMADIRSFYEEFDPGRNQVTTDALRRGLAEGDLSTLQTIFVRAVLSRWRLRPINDGPFDGILKDYERGLLPTPHKADWVGLLNDLDAQWRMSRWRWARGTGEDPYRMKAAQSGRDWLLGCSPPAPSSRLGSLLEVTVSAPSASRPEDAPILFWATTVAPISPWRRRLGTWQELPGEAGDPRGRYKVTFDLSWEPAWLSPGARVTHMMIQIPGVADWKPERIEWRDSPLLPVGRDSGSGP